MRNHMRRQRGQSLVETGLVIGLLIIMVLGIIEFGYVFFALNMVTNAARDGSRVAAALQNRGTCGNILDSSSIRPIVLNALNGSGTATNGIVNVDGASSCSAGVCVDQCNANGSTLTCPAPGISSGAPCPTYSTTNIPVVRVTVAGHIPYLFGLLGSSAFNFSRAVTFRDEGR